MKLYLLYNGVNVRLMSLEGPNVPAENFLRAFGLMREFFNQGTCEAISEITIRPEAVETIVRAIGEFSDEPVPLHTALSELLNFCRNAGDGNSKLADLIPALSQGGSGEIYRRALSANVF